MNAAEISSLVTAAVALAGALTAWLRSRTAAKSAASAVQRVNDHIASHSG
jgi:hypothetical protein